MQKITARRTGFNSTAYAANDRSTITLPNVDRWHRIFLEFDGTATIAMGAGTAVYTAQAPYNVIRQLTLSLTGYRALGAMVLVRMSGYQAAVWERVENPGFDDRETPAVQSAASLVNGANTIHFSLMLPISVGEVDFTGMLPLGGEKSAAFTLDVDWASANSDIVTVAGGAAITSVTGNITCSSETFQFLEGEPKALGLREDIIHQITSRTATVAATGDNRVALSTGVLHLRIINILRQNGAFSDTTWDVFELIVEDTVRPYTMTQRQWLDQQRYRNVDRDYPTGTYALDRYWTRTWRDVYDALKLTRFEESFNVTTAPAGTTDLTTIQEVAIPTPQAAKKAA